MRRPRVRDVRRVHPSIRTTLDQLSSRSEVSESSHNVEPFRQTISAAQPQPVQGANFRRSQSRSQTRGLDQERRLQRSISKKKSNLLPTRNRSLSRQKGRKRSRSNHRKASSNTKRTAASPSGLWRSLPLKMRVVMFLIGFMLVYYGVFAKHHYFDKEMSAIQSDVERLLQQANRSGFLQRKFEEAELPSIFKESEEVVNNGEKAPTGSTSSAGNDGKRKESKDNETENGEKRTEAKDKTEQKKSGKQKSKDGNVSNAVKKKTSKGNAKQDNKAKPKKGDGKSDSSSRDTNEKGKDGDSKSSDSADSKISGIITAPADAVPANPSKNGSARVKENNKDNDVSKTSDEDNERNPPNETIPKQDSMSSSNTTEDTLAEITNSANVSNPSNLTNSTGPAFALSTIVSSSSDGGTVPADSSVNVGGVDVAGVANVAGKGSESTTSKEFEDDESREYTKEFHDLTADEVPKDHLPVLTWNYQAVLDANIPEQIFGLGDKLDHVAVYKPLCINTVDETAFMFQGKTVCGGFNRTQGWLIQYCSVMKESLQKEYLLQMQPEPKPRTWLKENERQIRWVNGLTVLQVLEKNCGNIAHYSGRILLLQHIIDNIMAYAAPPNRIMNILIVPTFHIMKRFLYPHNYEYWHKTLLSALIAPSNFTIGTLGNFLYRDSKPRADSLAMVQLLHNFSMVGSGDEDKGKQYVCFRRVAIPGYLKARFFVNDMEYPSTKPSLQSSAKNAPKVPRDSLRMRERVSALVEQSPKFAKRKKEIVLLDRNGSRRVFGPEAREKVLAMLKKVADEKEFSFKIVSFDKMTFQQQYHVMKSVSIAIGIHGANLVNTMFMPPLAVLIEVFPFGFHHEMYVNGGNAGLKYFAYRIKEGIPFEGPKLYRSVEQCIKLNQKCKVHYRDAIIKVNDIDMAEMEQILRDAVDWCNALPNSEPDSGSIGTDNSDSEQGNQRRRARRRRRLLDRQGWG